MESNARLVFFPPSKYTACGVIPSPQLKSSAFHGRLETARHASKRSELQFHQLAPITFLPPMLLA